MCGILVSYPKNKNTTFNLHQLQTSLDLIKHRGPDYTSYYFNEGVFLGHNRLSIVDLDKRSNQPYFYKHFVIVFNGEIFNYQDIRELLIERGLKFDTNSDTEVLLKAFTELGVSMYNLLNGFWSFVIYDIEQDVLHVSRDRFGQKPLFVKEFSGGFLFSSEIKPIFDLSPSNPNLQAISDFLLFSYDNLNETFFEDIDFFQAAHHCIYKNGKLLEKICYWKYPETNTLSFDNDHFNKLLNDAVKIRMSKEVSFMLAGSSGMDSSLIQSIISNNFKDNTSSLEIVTYSDSNMLLNESYKTQKIAHLLGNNCTIVNADFNLRNVKEDLSQILIKSGIAFPSIAILSYNEVLKKVSQNGVKILIDGQGADECLGGYIYLNYYTYFLYFLKKGKLKIAFELIKKFVEDPMNLKLKFSNFLRLVIPRYFLVLLNPNSRLINFRFIKFKKVDKKIIHSDKINKLLIYQHQYILHNLLFYGDIISMKYSVESRSPFLDHRLVDYLFSTDYRSKYNPKSGFKAALYEHPDFKCFSHMIDNRKLGFNTTINESIIKEMYNELRNSKIFRLGIFNEKRIQNIFNKNLRDENIDIRFIFRLYQIHLWIEIFNIKTIRNEKLVN